MATCTPEAATAATAQTRARLGAYYFDGWSRPLSTMHFMGMVDGPYADREPYTGWLDSDACTVEKQLATARAFGIDFFLFDWYFGAPATANGERLNSAFEITRALQDRHGMQYAVLYVNNGPFDVPPSSWPDAVAQWVSYFQDADYVRVQGKPLFMIIDSGQMRTTFGSSDAVAGALAMLRQAAQAAGLPGVYVVGGVVMPTQGDQHLYEQILAANLVREGYDAIGTYNYVGSPPPIDGMLPYSTLAAAGRWTWAGATAYSPLPFIPVAVDGWDPRPWQEKLAGKLVYYDRSPSEVAQLVADAADWAEANPLLRVEPAPAPPMVLLEAWNELGEGSYLVPTVADGRSYGDALAGALTAPPAKSRSALTVVDSGASAAPRQATGRLVDGDGTPIAGADVAVSAAASAGSGFYAPFTLVDDVPTVPSTIASVVVGFRLNSELVVPSMSAAACNFALYRASFQLNGTEMVANGDFSSGLVSWTTGPPAQLVASDRGAGQMLSVDATAAQAAALTSAPIAVTPGAPFQFTMSARVAPACAGAGYFALIFLDGSGMEAARLWIPFASGFAPIATATTDGSGNFAVDLSSLGTAAVTLRASYAGDARHWPAATTR